MSGKNPFYDPEDEVDDEEFLRHPRNGPGYILPQHSGGGGGGGGGTAAAAARPRPPPTAEEMRQQMLQRKREIEERTVESSQRSLGMLYESEKVGQNTASDLARQKEQLRSTEARLDDINSTLKQSERHLTGIKSVFGGLRNYFSGRNAAAAAGAATATSTSGASTVKSESSSSYASEAREASGLDYGDSERLDYMRRENHPGLRGAAGSSSVGPGNTADDVLDRNLEEMSLGLGRLKGLATNLNRELDEHNEIIDRLDHKTSSTHWRVEKQNKDIGKILKK